MSQAARLTLLDWDDLLPRLLLFAERLHGTWQMHRAPGSPSPEDLVNDAITAAFEGRRTWPSGVDAYRFLSEAVRSLASNALARSRLQQLGLDLDSMALPFDDPAQVRLIEATILDVLDGDQDLITFATLLFEDPRLKPLDIAALMDRPIREIRNIKRRFHRRMADCLGADGGDLPAARRARSHAT